MTRNGYVHEAVLLVSPGTDDREPGALITTALCGSWTHPGPCPLAPHHTSTRREGERLTLRVLFVADQHDERTVREQIVAALADAGQAELQDPTTSWRLINHHASALSGEESQRAIRLAHQ